MKYIAANGQIAEGIPLTEEQVTMREKIIDFVHAQSLWRGNAPRLRTSHEQHQLRDHRQFLCYQV